MKRGFMLFVFVFAAFQAVGQQQTTYNKKGDDAMARADYSDAKMWYEEGVVNCDLYSIRKITQIWREHPEMRASLRSLTNKCFNCLTAKSAENDTTAIQSLIYYHQEGIGVAKNKTLATYWTQRLNTLKNGTSTSASKTASEKRFFIGYNYSMEAPFGFTVGAIGKKIGWYARIKSNLSFASSDGENNNEQLIPPISSQYKFDNDKINAHAGSAGVILKWTDHFQTSVGLGYGIRNLLWHHTKYENDVVTGDGWTKNTAGSNSGILTEIDVIWNFGGMFVSAGCYSINFKYVDLNAGIGVYF
jgi:hypothetical protein